RAVNLHHLAMDRFSSPFLQQQSAAEFTGRLQSPDALFQGGFAKLQRGGVLLVLARRLEFLLQLLDRIIILRASRGDHPHQEEHTAEAVRRHDRTPSCESSGSDCETHLTYIDCTGS